MNKLELFGPKVDFLIVPVVVAIALYLFYGTLAAVLALGVIVERSYARGRSDLSGQMQKPRA